MKIRAGQNVHAKKRALERYGLILNKSDIMEIVKQIIRGSAICLGKQTCSRTIFLTTYKGVELKVVYDKKRKSLRTILPNN